MPIVEEIHRIIENKPAWLRYVREILDGKGIPVTRNLRHWLWKTEQLHASRPTSRRKFRTGVRLDPVPSGPSVVWCTDFAENWAGGCKMFVFLVKDEATGFCLTSKARFSRKGFEVRAELDRLVAIHGLPGLISSGNGGQSITRAAVGWAAKHRILQTFIISGRAWQNGAAESPVATLRVDTSAAIAA